MMAQPSSSHAATASQGETAAAAISMQRGPKSSSNTINRRKRLCGPHTFDLWSAT